MARYRQGRFFLFLVATWCLVLIGAELVAQVAFQLVPESSRLRRLAYPSRFSLHHMARLVDDARVSTLVPGYRAVLTDGRHPSNPPWRVEIDENGFRGRKEHYEGRKRVVVFIGDSVPFGWGVSDEATVPFRFRVLLDEHGQTDVGVLNGALPSYSLLQAVERYRQEIRGRYPVASVIVQTFDPVTEFASDQPRVRFFDVEGRFEVHPRRARLFVDTCCHLSEEGAELQARYLFQEHEALGLLASTD